MTGVYATLQLTFGGAQPATVKYGGGLLRGDGADVDLHEVMVQDAVSGAVKDVLQELGEHALAEIRQQIAYHHAKGVADV